MANETLDLAIDLLTRKSLTPNDAGCHDLMAARLQKLLFLLNYLTLQFAYNRLAH